MRYETLIDHPVEGIFPYLVKPDLVVKWASNAADDGDAASSKRVSKASWPEISQLVPKVSGPPAEGAEYDVELNSDNEPSTRVIEMYDEPYGATVRFSIPSKRVRRFYRLMPVSNGTKFSVVEYQYHDSTKDRILLLLREPFWIFALPFLRRFHEPRRKVVEDDVTKLRKVISGDAEAESERHRKQQEERQQRVNITRLDQGKTRLPREDFGMGFGDR
ncbi:hypothetical protein [Streptomyces coffeae]|uniref:SRPBCC family protein n=1 Tax=Streptomyces coffeae TaxID=621382 RepID=A0ABS1NPD5_9ACTN|nr:hypothetical protein [Streptomyces coffeae]MBL1101606.1 hypothetical protein [Streptomyces coffeae]